MTRDGFELGDLVEWTSQSQGYTRTKRGHVVAIVLPDVHPLARIREAGKSGYNAKPLYRSAVGSLYRRHESYLIAVPTKSGKGRPRLYWPVVSLLKLAPAAEEAGT